MLTAFMFLGGCLAATACGRDSTLNNARVRATTTLPAPPNAAATSAAAATTATNNAPAAGVTAAGAPAGPRLDYRITIDAAATVLKAEVCPTGMTLKQLRAPIDEAEPLIRQPRTDVTALIAVDNILNVGAMPARSCVHYQVDLKAAMALASFDGRRVGDDMLLSPDLWLWTPSPLPPHLQATAHFSLPPGWRAALPWPKLGEHRYRIPKSAFVWRTQGAFGTLPARVMHTGKAKLDSYVLGDGWGRRHEQVLDWVQGSADAVTALFGKFPTPRAQVLLITTPAGSKPFGMAMHGGGMSAFVLVPKDIDTDDVDARWTVVHELLHFSLPPIVNADAWLHEGITTYLTTKARARAGLIDESFAWWELLDGFERGRGSGTGLVLREESAKMHQTHAYWRVYWSGAAMALSMDMALTEQGGSLEKTLLAMAAKKVDHGRRWNGPEVLKLLDQACGSSIPSDASQPHLGSAEFPDTETLAKQLGVRISGKHRSSFDPSAPKANLRRELMRPARPR